MPGSLEKGGYCRAMAPVQVKSPTHGLVRPWRQIVPAELASDAIVRRYSDACLVHLYVRDVAQLLRVVDLCDALSSLDRNVSDLGPRALLREFAQGCVSEVAR
jgi:hypothetical protein